jgi:hypothetical protein
VESIAMIWMSAPVLDPYLLGSCACGTIPKEKSVVTSQVSLRLAKNPPIE